MIKLHQGLKFINVIILSFSTIFICTVFVNYGYDLRELENEIMDVITQSLYEAQKAMINITVSCIAGIMGTVTFVVLIFTVSRYINENQQNMGMLKALGYPPLRIAVSFLSFGFAVFVGSVLGFAGGYAFSPVVYDIFNNGQLPEVKLSFHFPTLLYLVVFPTIFFSLSASLYALIKLKKPPLEMIRETRRSKINKITLRIQSKESNLSFLQNLKRTMLLNNLTLVFFIGVAGFSFASQIQLAFLMRDLNMDIIFLLINLAVGIVLSLVTLLIVLSYVLNTNRQSISLLKAYGYTVSECGKALFGGYRMVSYIGFVLGTIFQFFFMKVMVSLFADNYPITLKFNITGFFVTLAAFLVSYEAIFFTHKKQIEKLTLKESMQF